MLSWLSKVDPNTIVALAGLLVSLATWSYHKVRGDKVDNFSDVFAGFGKQVLHVLLTDPSVSSAISPEALSAKATELLWGLATKAGVPRNALTESVASALVEHVVGDALAELRKLDAQQSEFQNKMTEVAASLSTVRATLAGFRQIAAFDGQATVQPDGSLRREPQAVPIVPPATPGIPDKRG